MVSGDCDTKLPPDIKFCETNINKQCESAKSADCGTGGEMVGWSQIGDPTQIWTPAPGLLLQRQVGKSIKAAEEEVSHRLR